MNYNKKLQLIKKIITQKKIKNKKFTYPLLTDGYSSSDLQEASKVLLNGRLTMSNITKKFEKYFAKKIGSKYALMVNSGSSANLLALFCLINPYKKNRLKKGDECIVPSLCWSTSLWPIIQAGLSPVFADVNLETFTLDLENIKKKITKKTKAIMILNVLGNCSEMDKIKKFCNKRNIYLIEDSCEALGSKYKNKYLGTYGNFGTFSFYYSHQITSGEGGMIVCDSKQDFNILKTIDRKSFHDDICKELFEELGVKVRITDKITCIKHTYSHFHLRMHAYYCDIISGYAQPLCADELQWINMHDIHTLAFPKANLKLLEFLNVSSCT